jgi:hypothetical protein
MRGWRVYPAVLLTVALAGCSSGAEQPELAPPAEPRTIELGWVERFRAASFVFRVGRLAVGDFVRVLFGPFSRVGGRDREAADVLWVTDHAARL